MESWENQQMKNRKYLVKQADTSGLLSVPPLFTSHDLCLTLFEPRPLFLPCKFKKRTLSLCGSETVPKIEHVRTAVSVCSPASIVSGLPGWIAFSGDKRHQLAPPAGSSVINLIVTREVSQWPVNSNQETYKHT